MASFWQNRDLRACRPGHALRDQAAAGGGGFAQKVTSTAFGKTTTNRAYANALFVEGKCVLLVGVATDGANPNPPVIAGALKVYGRTAHSTGVCA